MSGSRIQLRLAMRKREAEKIVVVGLGYVGAPLALELQKHFSVTGYDLNKCRIAELLRNEDRTGEMSSEELEKARWELSSDPSCLQQADLIIVTVPTPVTSAHVPDLHAVMGATA